MQNQSARLMPIDPVLMTSLRDHVHKALRMAIIGGRYAPQSKLNERQLAEELGVSTTPLKEALRQLESEGLVRTVPRRGVVVLYGRACAEEMILARAALESMLARMAAQRISADDVLRIKAILVEMRAATGNADTDRLIALNETFHDAIHLASQCDYLSAMIERQQLYDSSTRQVIHAVPSERAAALKEHETIGSAIIAGDIERAERAMRDHVLRSGDIYLATVFPSPAKATGSGTLPAEET
jgi:DNA-binding GntR family transcriptional regulator